MSKILDYVKQPDVFTCQSACIAKILGSTDVYGIRAELESMGQPGDPAVMGDYLRSRVQSYKYLSTGSLIDAKDALDEGFVVITHGHKLRFAPKSFTNKHLDEGFVVITHGHFTNSGHVICLVGHEPDPNTPFYRFIVDDPFAEFSFPDARYIPDSSGDNVRYSSYGIYAYCVASSSYTDAAELYATRVLLSSEKGAWLHIIKN